jgi:hypothetical protein
MHTTSTASDSADVVQTDPALRVVPALKGIPASLLFVSFLAIPFFIVGLLPIWESTDGYLAIALVSAPLFIFAVLSPLVYLFRSGQYRVAVCFIVICVAYLIEFGIRSYYHLLSPHVFMFPNFAPRTDLLYLHRGLMWAAAGVFAMTYGYFALRPLLTRSTYQQGRRMNLLYRILQACSRVQFILLLYTLGVIGRLYSLSVGSTVWIYNSPAFDSIATRSSSFLGGPMSLLAEFCTLGMAAMLASRYQFQSLPVWKKTALNLTGIVMIVADLVYYTFGVYKFGLLGVLLVLWVVPTLWGHSWTRRGILLGAIFLVLVFPIANYSRESLIGYYKRSLQPSAEWFGLMGEVIGGTYSSSRQDTGASILDQFFERLNGAESLAVAEKYLPQLGLERGRTYLNLFTLSVPRVLRFGYDQPIYINWAVDYVGLAPTNPTVIPMPALVEAFLNFSTIGVLVIMFLLGILYSFVDSFSLLASKYAMATGILAYAVWRLANIEQNLFIVLPALAKTIIVVLIICWLYAKVTARLGMSSDVQG